MDATSSKVSKPPLSTRLKELLVGGVISAIGLGVVWWLCLMAVVILVDGGAYLVGYARTAKLKTDRADIERRIARLEREVEKVERSSRSPKGKRAAREELESDLDRARKRLQKEDTYKPLPPTLDVTAEQAVRYGPRALFFGLIVWTMVVSRREAKAQTERDASRAAEDARQAAERERTEAEWRERIRQRAEAERTAAQAAANEQPTPRYRSCIRIVSGDEAEQFHREVWSECGRPVDAEEQARRDAYDAMKRAEAEEKRREQQRREAIAKKPNMPPASDAAPKRDVTPEAEEDPEQYPTRILTHAQWHAATDARELLRHAISRIPTQHVCLLLAELAEELWQHFHALRPNDWRPAWCIATVRAWCFGEATLEEVAAAREAARATRVIQSGRQYACEASMAMQAAIGASVYAHDEGIEFDIADAAIHVLHCAATARHHAMTRAVLLATDVADKGPSPVGRGFGLLEDREVFETATAPLDRAAWAELADRIRARVAWPARSSERWVVRAGEVNSGDATLVVDGWRVVECRAYTPERRSRPTVVQ